MPNGLEQRVTVLERKVATLEAEVLKLKTDVGKNTDKLATIEWDADHIGAEVPPYERKKV